MKNLRLFTLLTILVLVFAACSSATPETAKAPAESGSKTEEKTETKEEAPAPAAATATPKPAESEAPVIKEGESTTEDVVREVSQYNEAPMLAEMVAAGELPPVDERLPKDVQVIDVTDSIGQYGGTWHAVTWWPGAGNIKMAMYDPPIRWKPDYSGYEPGLAKKYEWSEDGTSITFHFREGLKWSDGAPFTMDDMKFWWEDIATNEDYKLIQVPWWGFKKDGTPMDVEFPDDYTMVFRWDTPQWVTPYILAQGYWEWEPLMKPKHFLSKYHPKYNPDATYDQLEAIDKWHETEGYPTLMAWYVQSFTAGEKNFVGSQSVLLENRPRRQPIALSRLRPS
jgi:peptide/nickel transport system substrate-binding protein